MNGVGPIAIDGSDWVSHEVADMTQTAREDPCKSRTEMDCRFQVRFVHWFYITALLASSFAVFGTLGWLPALVVLALWSFVWFSKSRPLALIPVCVGVLILLCFFRLLLPDQPTTRGAAMRTQCANNMRQIGLALQNYHTAHGAFPPAYFSDKTGRPIHSWRVLILPFLGENNLFKQYRFDEPWDGPTNQLLLNQIPQAYQCPSRCATRYAWGPEGPTSTRTSYVAVLGTKTIWPGGASRKLDEISDETDMTLMVIEAGSSEVKWLQPTDIRFEDAIRLLSSADRRRDTGHEVGSRFFEYARGGNMLFADGSVRYYLYGLPVEFWTGLLTIDGEVEVSDADYSRLCSRVDTRRWLKLGSCSRVVLFALLIFLPLPWVWIGHKARVTKR